MNNPSVVLKRNELSEFIVSEYNQEFVKLIQKEILIDILISDSILPKSISDVFISITSGNVLLRCEIENKHYQIISSKLNDKYFITFILDSSVQLINYELLKLLENNTNDVIWLMDLSLQTYYITPTVKKVLGYTPQEYMSLSLEECLPIESVLKVKEEYKKGIEKFYLDPNNDTMIFEMLHRHKNNELGWGELNVKIISNEKKEIIGFLGVTRNIDDRYKILETIKSTNEKYQAIIKGFDGLIYICSSDYKLEFVNEPFLLKVEENPIGKTCYKTLHGFEKICPWCVNNKITHDEKIKFEFKHPNDDKWYSVVNVPLNDNGIIKKLTLLQDISQQKLFEISLKESEDMFRNLAESSPVGILIVQNESVIYTNPISELLTGYTKAEIKNLKFYDIIHPDFKAIAKRRGLERQAHGTDENRYVFKFITKSGIERWVDYAGAKTYINGKPAVIGTVVDITQFKETELALRESEEKYRQIIELAVDGIIVGDDLGNITDINRRMEDIIGKSRHEIIGKHITELFPRITLENIPLQFESLQRGETIVTERIILHPIKGEVIVEMHSKQMPDKTYQSIIRDISLRRKLEKELVLKAEEIQAQNEEYKTLNEELQEAKDRAEESDKLKTAFLANMSHEIRTPLNVMLGFSEMLKRQSVSDEKNLKYINLIHHGGKQLLGVIDDIIDISKIEAGQMILSKNIFSPSQIINQLIEFFEPLTKSKGLNLTAKIDYPDNLIINSDENKLKQILTNLIGNAIKFTETGSVTIQSRFDNNELYFMVSDTGIGIEEKYLESIFDRFRQVDSSSSRKYGGTGLGLAIVNAMVDLLNGKIGIQSEINKGSSFWFQIPIMVIESDSNNNPGVLISKSIKDWSRFTLVIADDEPTSKLLLREILSFTNISVFDAEDGLQVIELVKKVNPDLVIMDLGMPKMDGYESANEIRKFNPKLPIIACSAFAFSSDKERAIACGFNAFITKPYMEFQIIEVLSNYIEN